MNLKVYLSTAADMYIKNYQIKTAPFQLGRIRYCTSSVKGAVARNSAKLCNYKMLVELRKT